MFQMARNVALPRTLVTMARIDPELVRLEKAERDAHGRFLRLANFPDVTVVAAAQVLWQMARADLDTYRARNWVAGQ